MLSDRGQPAAREAICADDQAAFKARAEFAANGLLRKSPHLSAGAPLPGWQKSTIAATAVLLPVAMLFVFIGHGGLMAVCLAIPFALIVAIRTAALWQLVVPRVGRRSQLPHLATHDLPRYSVLVPLFREAAIAPALVHALKALDYPRDRLEILFITEASDAATRAALIAAQLPSHMRVLTVPAGLPQTKPRALNYALATAIGDFVAVFDAEDVPEPGQLRRAVQMFAQSGPDLVCVQARLKACETEGRLLPRQFALEYAALFEAILPALERLGLPIPLGGTSNHFRRSGLIEVGAWDAYNVTEDADLGVRLVRSGKHVAMLDSETLEDAPASAHAWLGQRTRWLKGWMQTYLVHMRDPGQLLADLGLWRFFGVQALLGGMILSALVHPWFYVAVFIKLSLGHPVLPEAGGLWALCCFNLAAGYAVGIMLGLIVAQRSNGRIALVSALLVPVYWLAISAASYRALIDLRRRPFYWEKTPHVAREVTAAPSSP